MDLMIALDRTSTIALYQQLSHELRQAVLTKRLKPNQKLPSSRALAVFLNVSRTTVTQSYDQLLSEGYLETRSGSGTFVCVQLPDDYLNAASIEGDIEGGIKGGIKGDLEGGIKGDLEDGIEGDLEDGIEGGIKGDRPDPSSLPQLSNFGTNLATVDRLYSPEPGCAISFQVGSPSTEHFPIDLWRRLLSRHCRHAAIPLNYEFDAAGYMPLRLAIADYLGRSRAVRCEAEQVIMVSGSQQALNLIARLTLDPKDWVALEDPGYLGARHCFASNGAQLQGIPVDENGLEVETLIQCHQGFKLLYVTPSHQFPTGATLSISRRLALLQWAHQAGTLILEDDYDSEYRYGDRPIPALQGLDQHNRVIYMGTFSKILFPALRMGYLVVPPAWVPIISRAKWLCDRHSPVLEQYALTDVLTEGHFERLIRKMRHLYDQRRQALVEALNHYFGARVTILGENAGIHLMAKLETNLTDEQVITVAQEKGIGLISAQTYYLNTPNQGEFIFGYAQLDEREIVQGIQILSSVLKS